MIPFHEFVPLELGQSFDSPTLEEFILQMQWAVVDERFIWATVQPFALFPRKILEGRQGMPSDATQPQQLQLAGD